MRAYAAENGGGWGCRGESAGIIRAIMWLARPLTLVFVAIVVALHVLRPDVSPMHRGISRYANGRTMTAMTTAFLALAGAMGIVAWTTRSWLLGMAAAALTGVAATPDRLDPPAHSVALVHTACALVFFVVAAAGIFVSHRSSPPGLAWLPAVATTAFFISMTGAPGLARICGVLQRLSFAAIVAWLLAAA
jgi:hypothetical protein